MALKRSHQPDPEKLYEPVQAFSSGEVTLNPGTRLQGDHQAVRAHFGSFMRSDLPDDVKARIRAEAMWGDVGADAPPGPAPDPVAQLPSGRFVATRSWQLADDDLQDRARINAGDILAFDDPVVQRYWHLFQPYVEVR